MKKYYIIIFVSYQQCSSLFWVNGKPWYFLKCYRTFELCKMLWCNVYSVGILNNWRERWDIIMLAFCIEEIFDIIFCGCTKNKIQKKISGWLFRTENMHKTTIVLCGVKLKIWKSSGYLLTWTILCCHCIFVCASDIQHGYSLFP